MYSVTQLEIADQQKKFKRLLAKENLGFEPLNANGNCLFYGLAKTALGDAERQMEVRQVVAQHIEDHRESYEEWFEPDEITAAIYNAKTDYVYCDNIQVKAFCREYKYNATIYSLVTTSTNKNYQLTKTDCHDEDLDLSLPRIHLTYQKRRWRPLRSCLSPIIETNESTNKID